MYNNYGNKYDCMRIRKFSVEFEWENISWDFLWEKWNDTALLFLHWAGNWNKQRFLPLRKWLLEEHNIASYAIDFIGHGETWGNLLGSSLDQRTQQVLKVVEEEIEEKNIVLVVASMSWYTAVKLTQHLNIVWMILMVPWVYLPEVYSVPFWKEFSNIIRQKDSWKKSDAFEIIKKYTWELLIISAEHDDVIPKEIITGLMDGAVGANKKEHIEISGAPHKIAVYFGENENECKNITQRIANMYENISKTL